MPPFAPESDPQDSLEGLIQAGQDIVQQFEDALSGANLIAPSDTRRPRRRRSQELVAQWDRWLRKRSTGTTAVRTKLGGKARHPVEPAPGRAPSQSEPLSRNVGQATKRRKL